MLGDLSYPGMTFMMCPSAEPDLEQRWQSAQEELGVPAAVQRLRSLKYRKVQGFESDDEYRRCERHHSSASTVSGATHALSLP
jgi:hypothetical protein